MIRLVTFLFGIWLRAMIIIALTLGTFALITYFI